MNQVIRNKLKQSSIVIVCHEYTYGPPHALEKHLRGKTHRLVFIAHPFVFAKDIRSYITVRDCTGKQIHKHYAPVFVRESHLSVIKDVVFTLWWSSKYGPFDYYIGFDGLSACLGILLRFFKRARNIIFYTIDFVPVRFVNSLFNTVYHGIDRIAVWGSDRVWNASKAIMDVREAGVYGDEIQDKQTVVPIGAHRRIQRPLSSIRKTHVVHMGHIIKKQGAQLLIESLPDITRRIENFHFHIVGSGDYEHILKKQANDMGVSGYISFHGYIDEHRQVEKILSYCAVGIATYEDTESTFAKYADPGKIKIYLACSLPVIVTKVPGIWRDIENNKCGYAIRYSKEELVEALIKLLLDKKRLKIYRENAYRMSEQFTYNKIYDKALEDTIINLEKETIGKS